MIFWCRHLPHGFFEEQLAGACHVWLRAQCLHLSLQRCKLHCSQTHACYAALPMCDITRIACAFCVIAAAAWRTCSRQLAGMQSYLLLCLRRHARHPSSISACCSSAGYFGQFGKVTKLRVSRSKRTGASKGYAFLQFQHSEVAKIAAESMNGYMMYGQTLQCHVVPPADLHPETFRNAHRKMRRKPWLKMAAERHNRERSAEEEAKREARLLQADEARRRKIAAAGIEYTYEPLKPRGGATKKVFDAAQM